MDIAIIVAIARNNAIGYQNKLIYFIKEDLKRFKQLTTGNTIIMGRKTFESLPKGALPNRRNIVLSRTKKEFPGCETFSSLNEAIAHCKEGEHIFIIGGVSVYEEALPLANVLHLTEVDDTPSQADAFFPEFDKTRYEVTYCEHHPQTEETPAYTFIDLKPKKK